MLVFKNGTLFFSVDRNIVYKAERFGYLHLSFIGNRTNSSKVEMCDISAWPSDAFV